MTEQPETAKTDPSTAPLALLAIVLLAVMLRVAGLPEESAWHDEVLSLRPLAEPNLTGFWDGLRQADPHVMLVPVYFTIEFLWSRLVGCDLAAIRLLSVLFGVLSIPLIFALGKRMYGAAAGNVAALCLAMSLPQIFYSQEIRMYALAGCLSLLSVLTFWLALHGKARWWLVHFLINALMLWTHLYMALQLLALGCFLLVFHFRAWRRWLAWGTVHAALLALIPVWVRLQTSHGVFQGSFWSPLPAWRDLGNTFLILAGGRFSNEDPALYVSSGLSFDRPLAALFIMLCLWLALWTLATRPRASYDPDARRSVEAFGLLSLWFVVPPAALFAMSYVYHPSFLYRYILFCAAPLCLLVGGALSRIERPHRRALLIALVATVYAYQYVTLPFPFRPDYRGAARIIESCGTPLDGVIVFKEINAIPFAFAAHMPATRPKSIQGFAELCNKVEGEYRDGRNTWIVMWRWDDTAQFENRLKSCGARFIKTEFGGMPRLLLYYVKGQVVEGLHWIVEA